MDELTDDEQAVELLREFGLKEYEAKSFVALSRLPKGTAKEISEVSEVPRTRVYDAIRALETKGLVEIQHSNPQVFRAVPIGEAVETLRTEYEERATSLRRTLEGLEPVDTAEKTEVTHEVWALTGGSAIRSRTDQLIAEADGEIVVVFGHEDFFTAELAERLGERREAGINVVVGAPTEEVRQRIQETLPETDVFVSGLDWLDHSPSPDDTTEIGQLVLVDRENILVSTFNPTGSDDQEHEQAVFGRGFHNGLVTIVRRILTTGLLNSATAEDRTD